MTRKFVTRLHLYEDRALLVISSAGFGVEKKCRETWRHKVCNVSSMRLLCVQKLEEVGDLEKIGQMLLFSLRTANQRHRYGDKKM